MGSYVFILPRCGEQVVGGMETLTGQLAGYLSKRGDQVEIWTTCAIDNRTWENDLPTGTSKEFGVTTRRFPVDQRDLEVWIPKQISIAEGMNLPIQDQLDWLKESVNSKALYQHIVEYGQDFDALFFAPYLFGTSFWGSQIYPERSYLIPCLHDESYAYTDVVHVMFQRVAGALFNAGPEQELAMRLYGEIRGGEVGMGFVPFEESYVAGLTPYFEQEFPYLLYMGRKETGKNVQVLIDYFITGKERGLLPEELKLVIGGGGSFTDIERPHAAEREDIVDLPRLSEMEKHQAMKHALCFCQPSLNESFSIVIMESWLLGAPVMVHANCAVTRDHVARSGGGLYFASERDFIGSVRCLLSDPELAKALAVSGFSYVRERYDWSAVIDRFDNVMAGLLNEQI